MARPTGNEVGFLTRRAALAGAACLILVATGGESAQAQGLRYDREYPVMAYEETTPTDVVARLSQRMEEGEIQLEFHPRNGYLTAVLHALGVSPASQVLVFSKTSLQSPQITAQTPRAIYFNDDVYVAWVPEGEGVEVAAMDPNLGPVFYTLSADETREPAFERETVCLQCHDTYSLTGGGVPRFLIGSGITSPRGQTVFHGGWNLTTDRTALEDRWGGWYVTGTHGSARHMGNVAVPNADAIEAMDVRGGGNVTDLSDRFDSSDYLAGTSDIVALLVAEHQITVQNLLTRANWESRTVLYDNRNVGLDPDQARQRIRDVAEPLARALLLVDQAPLPESIEGTSGFRAGFEAVGPHDSEGRSLRSLHLRGRLFWYPVSYLVYSEAFAALPGPTKSLVFERIHAALTGAEADPDFAHAGGASGREALEILRNTHPPFRAWLDARTP